MLSDTPATKLDLETLLLLELAVSFTTTGRCCMGRPAAPEPRRATIMRYALIHHSIADSTWWVSEKSSRIKAYYSLVQLAQLSRSLNIGSCRFLWYSAA